MAMHITIPWKTRMHPGTSGNSIWIRKHHQNGMSTPRQSVTMHGDDLDHLEAIHRAMATGTRRKNWFPKRRS